MLPTSGYEINQLVSVPRYTEEQRHRETASSQLFPALVAAHSELQQHGDGAALMSAWVRDSSSERFRILLGANPQMPGVRPSLRRPGDRAVLYPPGAIARALPPETMETLTGQFPYWVRCPGASDALSADTDQDNPRATASTFVEYAAHLRYPFTWLVIAEPLSTFRTEQELLTLANDIPRLRLRVNAEADRINLERGEARFRELTKAQTTGLWTVHVLVGATTPAQARAAAAVLCTATVNSRLPYTLTPATKPDQFTTAWNDPVAHGRVTSPFVGGSELVTALTAPPDRELPGIQLLEPNDFDVTPEPASSNGVDFGTVLDRAYEAAGPMTVNLSTLNRHAFISGATGSGKSQTTRWLLEQLAARPDPIPWMVLEPAKAEYSRMAGRLAGRAEVIRIRPGDRDVAPAALNPLEPAAGFPLQSHLDLVRALFLAAFEADEPFPQVLAQALTQTYRAAGWDLVTGEPRPDHKPQYSRTDPLEPISRRYPSLDELQAQARRVVDDIGYGKEITANVQGFIDVRIGSLCNGTPGRFFRGGHPLDIHQLLQHNVVLELELITDDQDKAFLMGALIIRIVEHLRMQHGSNANNQLHHVTIIEEAHRLLKKVERGPAAAAVELFASLLAEIRAYGEGIVVVEQIPSKIVPDVIKNTALKVLHRLPAADDRDAVGGTINLTPEQSRLVVSLPPGTAAAAVDGMDRPILIKLPPGDDREDATPANDRPPFAARRSPLCGTDCRQTACTLRQINDAHHQSRNPKVIIWTEAITISYLSGLVPPMARDEVLAPLRESPRLRDCTLAHAIETAVAARRHLLTNVCDPADLQQAIHRQLHHQLTKDKPAPVPDYRYWQAGPHRYQDIQELIRNSPDEGTPEPRFLRHWISRGLELSKIDQVRFAAIRAQIEQQKRRAKGSVILGDTTLSGLIQAIESTGATLDENGVNHAVASSCTEKQRGATAAEIMSRLAPIGGGATDGTR